MVEKREQESTRPSPDANVHDVDEGVERAWLAEAERRYRDYRAGKTKAIPADEVFAHVKARLAKRNGS